LLVCLLATAIGWTLSRAHLEERESARFQRRVRLGVNEIQERIRDCEQALQGARSHFAGSQQVTRAEWRAYVASLDLRHLYSVVEGLGFVACVPRADRDAFVKSVRNEGMPDFRVRPETTNAECYVVKFIEPAESALAVLGFDLGSDAGCRAAAERARDTGAATMTRAWPRSQHEGPEREMLILSPVYRPGASLTSMEERRGALEGWVYAPFLLSDLMRNVIGPDRDELDFDLFADLAPTRDGLLFDDDNVAQALDPKLLGKFAQATPIGLGGQTWTLYVTSRPAFHAAADQSQPVFILIGGLCISLLTFFTTRSLVTTRQRAEVLAKRMTEKSRLQERAIVASNVGIIITDATQPDNPVIYVNPAMERIAGCSAAEMVGRNCRFLQGQDRNQPGLVELRAALREERGCRVTLRNHRKDGTSFWSDLSISPVRDDAGRLTHFVGLAEDISARKQAEQALRDAKEAAEAASRAKSQFLANMSHEIRTPMNGITGLTDLALDTNLTDEQRGYLSAVKTSADDLLRILNDVLDFSKIEAGKFDLQPESFALREALQQILTTLGVRAQQKGLELALRVAPEVPDRFMGDVGRLRQILLNLIANAIKFTPYGKVRVTVTLAGTETLLRRRLPGERPDAAAAPTPCRLHFCVSDTGIGIAADKHNIIFEAFTQADTSITRKYGGTGLGLAIAARLTQLLGGQIWVESEVGRGSRFHFTVVLPVDAQAESASEAGAGSGNKPPEGMHPLRGARLRVLLGEDNPVNREVAEATLKRLGHSVECAANGREILAALEEDQFDLVLMDLQMPDVDGFEATTAIRRKEQATGRRTPIIALTAHALADDRERCLAAGMDDYLAKPLCRQDLVAALARWRPDLRPEGGAPQATAPCEPAVDRAKLLHEVEGNTALIRRMAALYFEHGPELQNQIRTGVDAHDWAAVERPAHKLKGSLSQFAAASVVACAQRLEEAARRRDPARAARLSVELEHELARFDSELQQFLAEL
jgi:PAS domain S-box-containing protein